MSNRSMKIHRNARRSVIRTVLTVIAVSFMLAVCAGGCASQHTASGVDRSTPYETVPDQPGRDITAASAHTTRAEKLLSEGKYEEAEAAAKAALEADVTDGRAHNTLGRAYFEQAKYYLAAWEFQYAIKLLPHRPEPKNNLGLVFEAVGKLDRAVECYGEARQIETDNPQFIGNLARAKLRRGDKDNEVRQLLADLVAKDTRPEWVQWARERLARLGTTSSAGQP